MGILKDLTSENSAKILKLNKEIYYKQRLVNELEAKEKLEGVDVVDLINLKKDIIGLREKLNRLEGSDEDF